MMNLCELPEQEIKKGDPVEFVLSGLHYKGVVVEEKEGGYLVVDVVQGRERPVRILMLVSRRLAFGD
ncbi:MAG: hypothetical protein Q8P39_02755 [Candidatus Yanofskybacteria bacterium]|nr:hypothetical protein [Candidatus Yanofskybacteria bacterium]